MTIRRGLAVSLPGTRIALGATGSVTPRDWRPYRGSLTAWLINSGRLAALRPAHEECRDLGGLSVEAIGRSPHNNRAGLAVSPL